MDTATLYIAHQVLAEGSIRGVARRLGRPPASVEAALARLEDSLSLPLAARAGTGLNLTLEARRIVAPLQEAAAIVVRMHGSVERAATVTVGLEALLRLSAVAEAGSIRRAARGLGIGQPQLTRQMSGLERALGGALLERNADGTRLTERGAEVIDLGARLNDIWLDLSAPAGERFRRAVATARLGSVMPLGHESQLARTLASLLARWRAGHPRQPLFISSTTADELLAGIKTSRFDAALLDTSDIPADCEGVRIGSTPLALVVGEQLPEDTSIAELLRSAPIAVPSQRSGLRQQFDRLLRESEGVEIEHLTIVEIDSIPVILNLVLEHGYVSLLPETAIATIREKLGQMRLDRRLDLWLVWPNTPAARQIGTAIAGLISG